MSGTITYISNKIITYTELRFYDSYDSIEITCKINYGSMSFHTFTTFLWLVHITVIIQLVMQMHSHSYIYSIMCLLYTFYSLEHIILYVKSVGNGHA